MAGEFLIATRTPSGVKPTTYSRPSCTAWKAAARLRWLDTWPDPGPADAFAHLGLSPDAGWPAAVEAAYARLTDHWAAEVAYHL